MMVLILKIGLWTRKVTGPFEKRGPDLKTEVENDILLVWNRVMILTTGRHTRPTVSCQFLSTVHIITQTTWREFEYTKTKQQKYMLHVQKLIMIMKEPNKGVNERRARSKYLTILTICLSR